MTSNYAGFKEQRTFTRFPASNDCAIMLSSANVISYSVLNISKVGLAFCYDGSINTILAEPTTTITFFSNDFGATDLPVELISDTELTKKDLQLSQTATNSKEPYLRKCSVKFLSMSQEQAITVDRYLRKCRME